MDAFLITRDASGERLFRNSLSLTLRQPGITPPITADEGQAFDAPARPGGHRNALAGALSAAGGGQVLLGERGRAGR